jgi:hypothetical protein
LKGIFPSIHQQQTLPPITFIRPFFSTLKSNQIKMSSATKYSTKKQMRSVSEQTWANIVSAAKPTKQTNKSRPDSPTKQMRGLHSGIAHILVDDIGSILVQLALEKKYKTEFAKKQKQASRPIAPKPAPTQTQAQTQAQTQTQTQTPAQTQNQTTNKIKKPLSKVELRKREERKKTETDEKCLQEIAKIVNLPIPKEEREKRIAEIICRKT